MRRNVVQFISNIPVEISLESPVGVNKETAYGVRVMYSLVDGRVMFLEKDVAQKVNLADVLPGQKFWICKHRPASRGAKVRWDVYLEDPTPVVMHETKIEAETPLEAALQRSIQLADIRKKNAQPATAPAPVEPEPELPKNAGTNGLQAMRVKKQNTPPTKVPYNVALREIAGFVKSEVSGQGLQLDNDAMQDLISTVFIQASKDGFLTMWERDR
jgi:hypothetical protein